MHKLLFFKRHIRYRTFGERYARPKHMPIGQFPAAPDAPLTVEIQVIEFPAEEC